MIVQKRVKARNKNQAWNLKRFYKNIKRISFILVSKTVRAISLDNQDFDLEEQLKLAFMGIFGACVVVVVILLVFLEGGN